MTTPATVVEQAEQAAEHLSEQMLSNYNNLVKAQGDRPAGTRARTMYEKSAALLPDWMAHAPAMTPDGEAWREKFVQDHGPKALLEHDSEMQRLYKDSRTSLDATLHMTPEQAGHYFAARDSGMYQHHPSVEGGQNGTTHA